MKPARQISQIVPAGCSSAQKPACVGKGNPMSKILVRGFLVLFIVSFLACSSGGTGAGYEAPGFHLKDLEGKEVSLQENKGSIVVVDFWATWCPPCRMSIPELVEIQKKYKEKGVVVLGISVDLPDHVSRADLLAFKDKLHINYTILRADRQVMVDYFGGKNEQMAIPTLFVVDKQGRVRDKLVGYRPGKIEESLQKLL
jgi:cytochrome c biogenesis protein CcmG, thiol:disulfide interchange protein DsbE